jgi:hypothetical protein
MGQRRKLALQKNQITSRKNTSSDMTVEKITPCVSTGMLHKLFSGNWHAAKNSYENI